MLSPPLTEASPRVLLAQPRRSQWWREVLIVAAFYGLYSLVRDLRGDRPVSAAQALTNAKRVISLERWVHAFHEAAIQQDFLSHRWLIEACDDYYGSLHFLAVIAVLVVLFLYFPDRYRFWRNALAISTGLALVGFSVFPVMPPRLLPASYHFVDTLKMVGGLWNFNSGPIEGVSNQYAAMPSLHTAWALWSALAAMSVIRPLWSKVLVALYPIATVFAIVVTANHYFADALAGVLIVAVSLPTAKKLTAVLARLSNNGRSGPDPEQDPPPVASPV